MEKKILLSHGGGGKLSTELVDGLFRKIFDNEYLDKLEDSAVVDAGAVKLCFTTDSYVVEPLFFPGGDIGKLSVCGTVNDLSVKGAVPLFLSCGFIIEEGFPVEDLERIARSMKDAADGAGVKIVTGDTKVVPAGRCGGVFINTSGIGALGALRALPEGAELSAERISEGDAVLVSGTLADHGMAVMSARGGFEFQSRISSDCACLSKMTGELLASGVNVKFMRDPTRGGVAAVLNEAVRGKSFSVTLDETKIPVKKDVSALCDLLGLDPLYVANEGKLIAVTAAGDAQKALEVMRNNPLGRECALIGAVTAVTAGAPGAPGRVLVRTVSGGTRVVDMPVGDQLPRIC